MKLIYSFNKNFEEFWISSSVRRAFWIVSIPQQNAAKCFVPCCKSTKKGTYSYVALSVPACLFLDTCSFTGIFNLFLGFSCSLDMLIIGDTQYRAHRYTNPISVSWIIFTYNALHCCNDLFAGSSWTSMTFLHSSVVLGNLKIPISRWGCIFNLNNNIQNYEVL
jgi:hypothetical protein